MNNTITSLWVYLLTVLIVLLLPGCFKSKYVYELEGGVVDEVTNEAIPFRKIVVHELVPVNGKEVPVYFDEFLTDSLGKFKYRLNRAKNVWWFNFILVGDSSYAFSNKRMGLADLSTNGKHLTFNASKLTDFTIALERKTKTSYLDTLYVSWESNGLDGRKFPYSIKNYGMNNYTNSPDVELRWIGGNIQSAIKTKVYAGKETIIHWELFRDGQIKKITDTIVCTRDVKNFTYFRY